MIQDIEAFCKLFYSTSNIPISCYGADNMPLCAYPTIFMQQDMIGGGLKDLVTFHRNVDYFITESSGMLGLVSDEHSDHYIIIGPVFPVPINPQIIHKFLLEANLPNKYHTELIASLKQTPQILFLHFLHTLAYLHLCLNDKEISIAEYFNLEDETLNQELSAEHINLSYIEKENRSYHNTASFEKQMYHFVEQGDVDKLSDLLIKQNHGLSSGTVIDNTLRQDKNLFIGIATVASRCAVLGGLDAETSYTMADTYIFKCEHLTDTPSIYQLEYYMLIDFASKVHEGKIPDDTSPEIYRCIQFIKAHTNDSIGLHDVARNIHRSDSYTSRKFKEELGFNVCAFIMRCKLEESKRLLTYSEKSLHEISSCLCFSDQAYFQRVFKKQYGLTPNNYRKQSALKN